MAEYLAWRYLQELPAGGEEKTMSDMTDAERLRWIATDRLGHKASGDARWLRAIADHLDAIDAKAPLRFGSTQSGRAEAYVVEGDVLAPGSRIGTTADGLPIYHADAMQWRDEPPDSEGDWLRNRSRNWQVFGVLADTNTSRIHQPGDRWLKLPPTP